MVLGIEHDDEFAVIEIQTNPIIESATLADRILRTLCEPFDLGDHQVATRASIGIALAPQDGDTSDDILRNADLALYSAKNGGRGTFRFFAPELHRVIHARRNLVPDDGNDDVQRQSGEAS